MKIYEYLVNKLELLEKIKKNTALQLKFVRRHEMQGLHRLLRERAKYLHRLTMLNVALSACTDESPTEVADALQVQIRAREQEILLCNAQTEQAAKEERDNIAASLRNIRQYKYLRNGYKPQGGYAGGRRFNKKV